MTHFITSHYRISFYISFLIFFLTSQHDNFHHKASLVMCANNCVLSVHMTVMYMSVWLHVLQGLYHYQRSLGLYSSSALKHKLLCEST